MGVLSNLEPASVFYYFEEICGIPHTSHHEKALSDYCVQFAKAHGLACRQDEMGNVLIKAPATPGYEKEPGTWATRPLATPENGRSTSSARAGSSIMCRACGWWTSWKKRAGAST